MMINKKVGESMWTYNYSDELYHYGVRGMRWGHRRYRNDDGSLTDKGIKKYAEAGYRKDSRGSNASASRSTHRLNAKVTYRSSSRQQNELRAEQHIQQGRKKATMVMAAIGTATVADLALNRGTMTKATLKTSGKIIKNTVKYSGRAAVSAYMMSKGHTNIKWTN